MKAGILTFHFAHNYGAALQAYALQTILGEYCEDVCIVDYRPEYISAQYKYFIIQAKGIKNILKEIALKALNFKGNIQKSKKFQAFLHDHFKLTAPSVKDADSLNLMSFQALIFGSDQIWNPNISGTFDKVYFGAVNSDQKCLKISYAASIGKAQFSEPEKELFKKYIQNINYISVREATANDLIEEYTDKMPEIVLDPTLLLSKEKWEKLSKKTSIKEKYLLVYEVSRYPETMVIAKKIADELHLELVEIVYNKTKLQTAHKQISGIGPGEFIGLFQNAEYIVTSSFHGTAFSIIFRKNFYTVPHKAYGERMTSLLNLLSLSDRIIHDANDLHTVCDVDYRDAVLQLKVMIIKSKEFLKISLARDNN